MGVWGGRGGEGVIQLKSYKKMALGSPNRLTPLEVPLEQKQTKLYSIRSVHCLNFTPANRIRHMGVAERHLVWYPFRWLMWHDWYDLSLCVVAATRSGQARPHKSVELDETYECWPTHLRNMTTPKWLCYCNCYYVLLNIAADSMLTLLFEAFNPESYVHISIPQTHTRVRTYALKQHSQTHTQQTPDIPCNRHHAGHLYFQRLFIGTQFRHDRPESRSHILKLTSMGEQASDQRVGGQACQPLCFRGPRVPMIWILKFLPAVQIPAVTYFFLTS